MPVELMNRIANQTLAMEVYASPYTAVIGYPVGTPEREGMTEAYRAVQRILASMFSFFDRHQSEPRNISNPP